MDCHKRRASTVKYVVLGRLLAAFDPESKISPLFSLTFLHFERNYLCFLRHSSFATSCGRAPLCFQGHSRVVHSFLSVPRFRTP